MADLPTSDPKQTGEEKLVDEFGVEVNASDVLQLDEELPPLDVKVNKNCTPVEDARAGLRKVKLLKKLFIYVKLIQQCFGNIDPGLVTTTTKPKKTDKAVNKRRVDLSSSSEQELSIDEGEGNTDLDMATVRKSKT